MKALFIHDHTFQNINGEFYSGGAYTADSWNRYFETGMIDKLVIVGRGKRGNVIDPGLISASNEGTEFDLLYEVKGGKEYYTKRAKIRKHLEKHIKTVDYVIIRSSNFGRIAGEICRKLNKPYITEIVACPWDSYWHYGDFSVKIMAPLGFYNLRKLVKKSFAALYVTQFFLQNRYPTNGKFVIHASNVDIYKPDEKVKEKRIHYLGRKGPNEIFKIGQTGHLATKFKGFDISLKALYKLKKRNPEINFKYYMIGGGNSTYLKILIKKYHLEDRVEILGRLESGEKGVYKVLDNLDIYIHPSRSEGLPRSVIEAMSRSCPVLASKVGGIPELVPELYLHNSGDDEKLYKDLFRVLTNSEERIQMARDNFEKSKLYDNEVLARRRVKFYKEAFHAIDKLPK